MSVSPAGSATRAALGILLRELLVHDPRYRRLWRRRTERNSADLNQAAVAKVIENYLWDSGERSESSVRLARQLKDRVSRALNGASLSVETLGWFVDAFGMDEVDERRLWDAFVNGGGALGISNTLRQRRVMIRRQCHRTISLVERYFVDRRGALAYRRTHHAIRAIEDGVDIYIFNHEPQASEVDVIHGGHLGQRFEYGGGLTSVEIVLDRPLRRAESTVLEYCTRFEMGSARLTEVRRAAYGRCENVDFAVEFTDGAIPRASWWCAWDDHLEGVRVSESTVQVERGVARRFVPYIEEAVVGFRWEW